MFSFLLLLGACAGGFVLSEGAVYAWHRWACHRGIFRGILGDFLRRRHFDHHVHKYPPRAPRSASYAASCDAAFRVMAVLLVALLLVAAVVRWLTPAAAAALFIGIALHGWAGARLHALYHLDTPDGPALRWLRRFHDAHHIAKGNYGLVGPLFDILGRSYIPPRAIDAVADEELFPHFDPAMSSSCGEPLIGGVDGARHVLH